MRKLQTIIIFLLGLPAIIIGQNIIVVDTTVGCTPLIVNLSIDSTQVTTNLDPQFKWLLGSGRDTISTTIDEVITDTIRRGGLHTAKLFVEYNNGSSTGDSVDIQVFLTQRASFVYNKQYGTNSFDFRPRLEIPENIDRNYDSLVYIWSLNLLEDSGDPFKLSKRVKVKNGNVSRAVWSNVNFSAINANYLAELKIRNLGAAAVSGLYACSDSSTQTIPFYELEVGNVFLPDVDEFFVIRPDENILPNDDLSYDLVLQFKVFTRSGLQVFKQQAPVITWDGRSNSGRQLETGVYFYILEATQGDETGLFFQKGFIHLFRGNTAN